MDQSSTDMPRRPCVGGLLPDSYLAETDTHRPRITRNHGGRVAEAEMEAAFHFGLGDVRSNGLRIPRPTEGPTVPGSRQSTSHRREVGGEMRCRDGMDARGRSHHAEQNRNSLRVGTYRAGRIVECFPIAEYCRLPPYLVSCADVRPGSERHRCYAR